MTFIYGLVVGMVLIILIMPFALNITVFLQLCTIILVGMLALKRTQPIAKSATLLINPDGTPKRKRGRPPKAKINV